MKLHDLKPAEGAIKKRKRVGRGEASGKGKTSGRGNKGQKSRSGYKTRPWFEGGQMPIYRRLPAKGHNIPFRKVYRIVNVGDLSRIENETEITCDVLMENGLIRKSNNPVKILGDGEINTALTIRAHAFSKSAKAKIEEAGGKAIVIGEEEAC
jgi:large subunit ribosomal protein L15